MKKIYEALKFDVMLAYVNDVVCESPYSSDGKDDMGSDIWPVIKAE